MGFFKNLLDKIRRKSDITQSIEQTTQIFNSNQSKFDQGLKKASNVFESVINDVVAKNTKVDQQLLDKIEEMLLSMDIGTSAVTRIMTAITDEIKYQNVDNLELVKQIIIDKIIVYYIQDSVVDNGLHLSPKQTNVILVSGVNGVGKTTTIAKMAYHFLQSNLKVCLVAGDTFRAGAIEQLEVWANKLNVPIFKPKKLNQDPASVIYDGLNWATQNKINIVLCDTSGRMQNKVNLMNELKKIYQVIQKFNANQPCESLLVIDATTGQSGIAQAKVFSEVSKISGIVLTKMDSTSKGGIILAIKDNFNIPVKFISFGETYYDLQPFDLEKYIQSLLSNFNKD